MKIFVIFIITFTLSITLFGEDIKKLNKKINYNEKILKLKEKEKNKTNKEIKSLASSIEQEEDILNQLERKLEIVSNTIALNRLKLSRAKKDIKKLAKESSLLQSDIKNIETKLVESIIDKYTLSLGKSIINKSTLEEIINEEKFQILFDDAKDTILKSNLNFFKLSNQQRQKIEQRKKLENYILDQEKEKEKFLELKEDQEQSVIKLKAKHKSYQKELKGIINKQYNLGLLLNKLNILKESEVQKAKQKKLAEQKRKAKLARLKKAKAKKAKQLKIKKSKPSIKKAKNIKMISKQNLQDEIDMKVRNLGDSSKGIKISRYKAIKLAKPLKSYTITKKFGKYYDPVYKIKLFNESISMKSKTPNAKVTASLKGKVVYAKKDAGALGNVVILKHAKNIHTVYSQLSQIPKTIKVGKWVPKGYVVGRVDDTLVFQVTKDNKYLNPKELF